MLDSKLLRSNPITVAKQLKRRGFDLDLDTLAALDSQHRALQNQTQALQTQRNQLSKAIGQAKASQKDTSKLVLQVNKINEVLKKNQSLLNELSASLLDFQLAIPNLLNSTVPNGQSEQDNQEIKKWGQSQPFDFNVKDHIELGQTLGQLDFEAAAKMSGSRFVVLHHNLARLERALAQFMLDLHVTEHGYQEVSVPFLVHSKALYGTGQLPKFREEQFQIAGEWDLHLIPTAEVSLVNLVRDSIIEADALPLKYVTQTPCFRSEAGSYGKDVRGMIRQHQFQKVEIVQLVEPKTAYRVHEEMLSHAEKVLQLLELPYRVVLLCSGDTGFSAAKTYDLEVWLPGQNLYREISSVSCCEAFQARRIKARYRSACGKPELLYTLNGSGLAVGRALIAVMENYQDALGRIHVPKALKPYMGNVDIIA